MIREQLLPWPELAENLARGRPHQPGNVRHSPLPFDQVYS